MAPSLLSRTIQGVAVTGAASVGAFYVWTKHCQMTPLDRFTPTTEPLFRSEWYKKFNPLQNPTTHDERIRRIPLFKLRPELVEDAQKGGSKLVEAFSQGIWGGPGKQPSALVPLSYRWVLVLAGDIDEDDPDIVERWTGIAKNPWHVTTFSFCSCRHGQNFW